MTESSFWNFENPVRPPLFEGQAETCVRLWLVTTKSVGKYRMKKILNIKKTISDSEPYKKALFVVNNLIIK